MKNLIFSIFILCCIPLSAQIQFSSFQEVLDYADLHAIAIQGAEINEQISISEKKVAASELLPYANASFGYNDNITLQPSLVPAQFLNPAAPEGEFQELTFGTKFLYTRNASLQWDILNFQKMFAFQTAKLVEEESKLNTELNRFNTYNQLASTYYSILLSQESIRIYEENAEVATSIFDLASEKHQQGLISEAEVNLAEIKKLQTQKNLKLALNNLDQFYTQLQSQLNTEENIQIKDNPDRFVLEETAIMMKHPELLWQEAQVDKYQSILKQTKASRIPSVSLIYQNNQSWATNDFMGFSDANRLPSQAFGVQISFSGFLSSSTRQKVKQSKWQLDLQQLQLKNTALVKDKEDELLQLQLDQASDQLKENKRILELQQKNDIHAGNTYQSGVSSLDARLDKYDDLLAAQDSYLQSLATYTLAQYKIYIRQIDFQPSER